ncbi:MAG: hypothetical protein MUE81_12450 [Thermoflexibacter sp.]|jgi:hypothetical protein|nr:hypothetical protein [Thermoflexibacter sp.]
MKLFKKILFIGLAVIALGSVGFFSFAYNVEYSTGFRAGKITKFTRKGYIFKTYEGALDVGGINSNKGMVSSTWDFSVDASQKGAIEAIEKAMLDGSHVKLSYEEKFFQFFWRGDTKYFITKVESHEVK